MMDDTIPSRLTNIDPIIILIFLLESPANYEQTDKEVGTIW